MVSHRPVKFGGHRHFGGGERYNILSFPRDL